jgi:O-antigen/teichoic acid export membrane protein
MWLTFKAGVGFGWAGVLSFAILPLNRAFLLQQPNSLATYGLFDLLTKLAEASSGVLTSAFTPLYRHFLQPSSFIAKRRLVRAGEAFVLVAWGCGVAIFMGIARPLLSFLLSKDASDIVVVAVVLLAFRASHAVAEPATRLLWAQDNKSVVLVARVLALALNVILLMVLLHATTLLWACAIAYAIPFAVSALIICIGTRVVLRDAWNGTTP